jgi:hypothetical protein
LHDKGREEKGSDGLYEIANSVTYHIPCNDADETQKLLHPDRLLDASFPALMGRPMEKPLRANPARLTVVDHAT